uniref:Uncharacterized protein n=1 Tax=Sphaerodactylus townsendi TaxID=933632 RepID=A0ACB8ECA1_9SAUR
MPGLEQVRPERPIGHQHSDTAIADQSLPATNPDADFEPEMRRFCRWEHIEQMARFRFQPSLSASSSISPLCLVEGSLSVRLCFWLKPSYFFFAPLESLFCED